jgi:release factor glutamine methyltransferase
VSVATGTKVRDALEGAITAIGAAGCETPRLDAEVLLADVLRVGRERLILDSSLEVSGEAVHAFRSAVRRRSVMREPVAYIIGRKHFRGIELAVDARVLIPRPETELLVEVGVGLPQGASVLDACTGSGAVALALKDERADLDICGSDVSEAALDVAKANGERLGIEVRWLLADLLSGVEDRFDAVLANPPYVVLAERSRLPPEIARHEPPEALFAGEDGLAAIAPLVEQAGARRRLRTLALEVGAGQAAAVASLAARAGFTDVDVLHDLAGIERVVRAERPSRACR